MGMLIWGWSIWGRRLGRRKMPKGFFFRIWLSLSKKLRSTGRRMRKWGGCSACDSDHLLTYLLIHIFNRLDTFINPFFKVEVYNIIKINNQIVLTMYSQYSIDLAPFCPCSLPTTAPILISDPTAYIFLYRIVPYISFISTTVYISSFIPYLFEYICWSKNFFGLGIWTDNKNRLLFELKF